MKKKTAIVLTVFLVGCMRVPEPPDDTDSYFHPINNQEWTLKKELEALGYKDVMFQIPMSRKSNYSQTYYLRMTTEFYINTPNIDSIVRFRDSLSKEMYVNIIDDSVLVDLKKLFILFYPPRPRKCKNCEYASKEYETEELAKKYGFKVVRDGKGGYKRVPVN
jgi:hypothetical protein